MKPWTQGCTNGDYCQNQSMQTVNIGVFSKDDIGVIPAQNTYHSNVGSQVNTNVSFPPPLFKVDIILYDRHIEYAWTIGHIYVLLLELKLYNSSLTVICNTSRQA